MDLEEGMSADLGYGVAYRRKPGAGPGLLKEEVCCLDLVITGVFMFEMTR